MPGESYRFRYSFFTVESHVIIKFLSKYIEQLNSVLKPRYYILSNNLVNKYDMEVSLESKV